MHDVKYAHVLDDMLEWSDMINAWKWCMWWSINAGIGYLMWTKWKLDFEVELLDET